MAIVGDSLVGTADRDEFLRGTLLREISSIDVRQFSPVRTGLPVVGGLLVTFVTAGILYATTHPWQF